MLESQAAALGQAPAIILQDRKLTFEELNVRVWQLAGQLHRCGVGRGDVAGAHLRRRAHPVLLHAGQRPNRRHGVQPAAEHAALETPATAGTGAGAVPGHRHGRPAIQRNLRRFPLALTASALHVHGARARVERRGPDSAVDHRERVGLDRPRQAPADHPPPAMGAHEIRPGRCFPMPQAMSLHRSSRSTSTRPRCATWKRSPRERPLSCTTGIAEASRT